MSKFETVMFASSNRELKSLITFPRINIIYFISSPKTVVLYEFQLPKSSRPHFELKSKRYPIVEDAKKRVLQHCVSTRLLQFGRNGDTFVGRSVPLFAQRAISWSLTEPFNQHVKKKKKGQEIIMMVALPAFR